MTEGPPEVSSQPLPDPGSGGALPILTPGQEADLAVVSWSFVEAADDGTRLILATTDQSAGWPPLGVQVTETLNDVTVIVYGQPIPPGPRTMQLITRFVSVYIAQPLGSRRLRGMHGPS